MEPRADEAGDDGVSGSRSGLSPRCSLGRPSAGRTARRSRAARLAARRDGRGLRLCRRRARWRRASRLRGDGVEGQLARSQLERPQADPAAVPGHAALLRVDEHRGGLEHHRAQRELRPVGRKLCARRGPLQTDAFAILGVCDVHEVGMTLERDGRFVTLEDPSCRRRHDLVALEREEARRDGATRGFEAQGAPRHTTGTRRWEGSPARPRAARPPRRSRPPRRP